MKGYLGQHLILLARDIDRLRMKDLPILIQIFDEGNKFISVMVLKGGTDPDDPHAVDAISGGTITSVALQDMLFDCLGNYETYFKNKSHE